MWGLELRFYILNVLQGIVSLAKPSNFLSFAFNLETCMACDYPKQLMSTRGFSLVNNNTLTLNFPLRDNLCLARHMADREIGNMEGSWEMDSL